MLHLGKKRRIVFAVTLILIVFLGFRAYKLRFNLLDRALRLPAVAAVFEAHYPITEKFWLHRTDSIEKLQEKGWRYAGVEFDLTWHENEQEFDVSHDWEDDIGLPLGDLLHELSPGQHIWFDYKNLTAENAETSLERLNALLEQNGVEKQQVLVENADWRGLAVYHDAGYYTSLYVPVGDAYLHTQEGRELFAARLREAVASGAVDAVSFPIDYYDLVKSLDLPVALLTWANESRWYEFYMGSHFQTVLEDPNVKVILVFDKAKINR